jgi:hypothetical protein
MTTPQTVPQYHAATHLKPSSESLPQIQVCTSLGYKFLRMSASLDNKNQWQIDQAELF